MKRKYLHALAGIAALGLVILAVAPSGAAETAKDVNVVNNPQVQISNTPTVNLAPGSIVGLNPSANTVDLAGGSVVGLDPNANTVSLEPGSTVGLAVPETFVLSVEVDTPTTGSGTCTGSGVLDLPMGTPVAIDQVQVSFRDVSPSDNPGAHITFVQKVGESDSNFIEVPIPLRDRTGFGAAGGNLDLDSVPVTRGSTEVGDITNASLCFNRGSADAGFSSVQAFVYGHVLPD